MAKPVNDIAEWVRRLSCSNCFELELLNIVAARGAGLFACEQWDVFSDVSAALVNGYVTIKVEDTFGEFHQLKRKDSGTWVNWGMFYQIWVKIREVGKWRD